MFQVVESNTSMSRGAPRFGALLIALAGWGGLALQAYLTIGIFLQQGDTLGDALWRLAGYFTILTNVLTALLMTAVALNLWPGGRRPSAALLTAVTLYIAVVGIVYHLFLRNVWNPEGLQKIADVVLHYVVPIAAFLFWVFLAAKSPLKFRHVGLWLIYPLGYCAYALARGAQDGWYPYPFIDVGALGLEKVLQNSAALTVAFAIGGCVLVAVGRLLSRRTAVPATS